MADQGNTRISVSVNVIDLCAGEPDVRLIEDGQRLQIYPTGLPSPCLFMTPLDWHKLNFAVTAAINGKKGTPQ